MTIGASATVDASGVIPAVQSTAIADFENLPVDIVEIGTSPVPAPAAVLLGFLGLGTAGWRLHRGRQR